ncbi:hypothetical protein D9M72_535370 [compost metagenome]
MRLPVIEAEVAVVGVQVKLRVQRVRIEAVRDTLGVLHRRREEETGKAQLGRSGIRNFGHDRGGEDGIGGNGNDGPAERGLPVSVFHRDHGGVAVAHEKHSGLPEVHRFVDFQDLLPWWCVQSVPGGEGGGEVDRLAELLG